MQFSSSRGSARSGPYGGQSSSSGVLRAAPSNFSSVIGFSQLFFKEVQNCDQPGLLKLVQIASLGPEWGGKRGLVASLLEKRQSDQFIRNSVEQGMADVKFTLHSKMADIFDLASKGGGLTGEDGGPISTDSKKMQDVQQSLVNFVVSYVLMLREYFLFYEAGQFGGGNNARDCLQNALHHCQTSLREWGSLYVSTSEGTGYEGHIWMIPCYQYLLAWARETAISIEEHFSTEENETVNALVGGSRFPRRGLGFLHNLQVDCLRKIFGEMVREKQKRAGFLTLTTELVRCYLFTYQTSGAQQVLKSVMQMGEQGRQPGFPVTGVPGSVAVSLAYYWGVILVQSNAYTEAEAKLSWSYDRLAEDGSSNVFGGAGVPSINHAEHRKQFLCYLIPLRIRNGILPSAELLKKYNLDTVFGKIVLAIREGDLESFEREEQRQKVVFVRHGTMNLWAAVKILVMRQLVRSIVQAYVRCHPDMAKDKSWKIDVSVIARTVVKKNPVYSLVEIESMLAQLIASGAMKGYLTLNHDKLVIPSANAWPEVRKCFEQEGQ